MNIYILSDRKLKSTSSHVGWSVVYSLENALKRLPNVTFIYPEENSKITLLKRYRYRLFKSFYHIKDVPIPSNDLNVLLIIGINQKFPLSVFALGSLLKKFDLKVAFILDYFRATHLDKDIPLHLDKLFVIASELADQINTHKKIDAEFLPVATDVPSFNINRFTRNIDVIGYGRRNEEIHKHLYVHLNQSNSDRIYFHTTFTQPYVNDMEEHMILLSKLLRQSKISLCFEPSETSRFDGQSPILYRWFEGWSCGCNIVGKKPFGKDTSSLMDWENSAIDIPDASSEWMPFFQDLLEDEERLHQNSQRNYRECLLRHDWRYRIRQILETLNLPIPENLNNEILHLQEQARQIDIRENKH